MGHLAPRNYLKLQKRMDQFIPGVPESKHLYEILKILFSEEEAKLCSLMPLNYFSLTDIARIWKKSVHESASLLQNLKAKGLVYEFKENNVNIFALAPPVLGFFEFSLMRLDGKFDRKKLSELYYKYINLEDKFFKDFMSTYPQISRILPQEVSLGELTSEVLPYEKASDAIDSATHITVGTCFCRHKMEHMGMACDNPQDVCLTFNDFAEYVGKHGIARVITKKEAHQILDLCIKRGLAQIADNTKNERAIICNCCGCCCDLLLAYKRFGISHAINPSRFIARVNPSTCSGCNICAKRCPVNVISMINKKPVVNGKLCLGCGVCTRFCPTGSIKMDLRQEAVFVPQDTIERIYLSAIRKNKLANFIFDNQSSLIHYLFRKLLNTVIKFPPIKLLLLNRSFYLFLRKRLARSVH